MSKIGSLIMRPAISLLRFTLRWTEALDQGRQHPLNFIGLM